jgi:hypothetical protein
MSDLEDTYIIHSISYQNSYNITSKNWEAVHISGSGFSDLISSKHKSFRFVHKDGSCKI